MSCDFNHWLAHTEALKRLGKKKKGAKIKNSVDTLTVGTLLICSSESGN